MVTITSAAPIDGPAILPNALIDQHIKPGDDQAALMDAFRLTALGWVERHTSHSLKRRRWVAVYNGFDNMPRLPREPVRNVVSVSYVDRNGGMVDGDGLWRLSGAQIVPAPNARWPETADCSDAVTITFEAGYDDVASEAPALQIAALLMMLHLYVGGSLKDVPDTVTLLLDTQYRTPVIG